MLNEVMRVNMKGRVYIMKAKWKNANISLLCEIFVVSLRYRVK